jgi:uncharacterized protein (DUF3820 family)
VIRQFGIDFDMKEPIICFNRDEHSTLIFESVFKAERYVEPIDIKIGNNVFYDSEGKILEGSVITDPRGIERTLISEIANNKFDKYELKRVLIDLIEDYLDFSRKQLEEMELFLVVKEALKFKTE